MAPLVAKQHGVFSREQAARAGATGDMVRARVRSGRWERLAVGVFRPAGMPSSRRQSLMVACLAAGPGAVVSHRAAAALWRLAGFDPGSIEITIPRNRHRRRLVPGTIIHALPPHLPSDVTVIDGIPVTSVTRTLLDIAAVAPRDAVEEALDDALRRRLVTIARLRQRAQDLASRGRPGTAAIRSLLDARDPRDAVPESVLETRLLRTLRAVGLDPVPQYRVGDGTRVVAVIDLAFPAERLGIEADGHRWHSGRARWQRDLTRRNRLSALGWRLHHVTWADIENPRRLVAEIRHALAQTPIPIL